MQLPTQNIELNPARACVEFDGDRINGSARRTDKQNRRQRTLCSGFGNGTTAYTNISSDSHRFRDTADFFAEQCCAGLISFFPFNFPNRIRRVLRDFPASLDDIGVVRRYWLQ